VYVKDTISKFCNVVKNECDSILWLKIQGKAFAIDDNLLIGTIYVPPINSKFSTLDIFEDVEKEIFNFSTENK
jgi:hypothetical protein